MGWVWGKDYNLLLDVDFIASLSRVFVKKNENYIFLDISSVRFHKNFAIIKFAQINSIDDYYTIRNKDLSIKNIINSNQFKEEKV